MPQTKRHNPRLDPPHLALMHLKALRDGKTQYQTADAALDALLKKKKAGAVIKLPAIAGMPEDLRGKKFRVRDKFADRNAIPVGQNARRFELEEVTEP